MRKVTLSSIALAVTTLMGSTAGHADLLLTGSIWVDQPALAADATIAGAPTTPALVTFLASDLNFHADALHSTIQDWLASAGATCLTGCTAANLSHTFADTYSLFHGTTGLDAGDNHFTIAHDDGVQ